MSDMGELFRDMKAAAQERRANNRENSPARLTEAGIKYESKNGGAHLVVTALGKTIDFWPGTGLWIVRGQSRRQRGVFRLINACTPEGQ